MNISKKVFSAFISLFMLMSFVPTTFSAETDVVGKYMPIAKELEAKSDASYESIRESKNIYKEFYVSENGNDQNSGTKEAPFKTIQRAKDEVKKVSDGMTGDIIVNIASGSYRLDAPLDFTEVDSGKNGYYIRYVGDKENVTLIHGGNKVTNMKKSEKYPLLYEAYLPGYSNGIREFYVNGDKRYVAKSENLVSPKGNYKAPDSDFLSDGMYVSKDELMGYDGSDRTLEFGYISGWIQSHVKPEKIFADPKNSSQLIIQMENPSWATIMQKGNAYVPSYDKKFFLINSMFLLDKPGEFYYDLNNETLYYMPMENESLDSEFYVPNLDACAYFVGTDYENRVENIIFENLRFSYFTGSEYIDDVYVYQGAYSKYFTSGKHNDADMGTFHLDKTSNIHFINDDFKGMQKTAIRFFNDADNSIVRGNTFSEIGGSSVIMGSPMHGTSYTNPSVAQVLENPQSDYMLNVRFPVIYASSSEFNENERHLDSLHARGHREAYVTVTDRNDYKKVQYYNATWESDSEDADNGKKAWVMYDFRRAYTISEVATCFDPQFVDDDEKRDYEILLSNDRDFKEGSYVVAATQDGVAQSEVNSYKINDTNKYRYVMIRTKDAHKLSLTFMYVFTPDFPNQLICAPCENITFSDNYVDRVADQYLGAVAVMAFAGHDLVITRNEITNVPYSAISLGWGWHKASNQGSNMIVSYNHIKDICLNVDDGGGMYTLGSILPCVVHDNYQENVWQGVAWYADQGSNNINYFNNVSEAASRTYLSNAGNEDGDADNFVYDLYTTNKNFTRNAGLHTLNEEVVYLPGNEPYQAKLIKENAGVSNEYKENAKRIESTSGYAYGVVPSMERAGNPLASFTTEMRNILDDILNANNFGSGYGQYSNKFKKELEKMISWNMTTAQKTLKTEELFSRIEDEFKRFSFDDTMKICDDYLSQVKPLSVAEMKNASVDTNACITEDYNEFKKSVNAIKNKAASATDEEKYNMVPELEKALNEFEKNLSIPGIDYIYVDGVRDVKIDNENKIVNVYVEESSDGEQNFELFLKANTKLADEFKWLEKNESKLLAIYSEKCKKYDYWTVNTIVENEDVFATSYSVDSTNLVKSAWDSTYYAPLKSETVYYKNNMIKDGENKFSFSVTESAENNTSSFIIGAKYLDNFKFGDTNVDYDRIEIKFKNKLMYIYSIQSGSQKLVKMVKTDISYRDANEVVYSINNTGATSLLSLKVNGVDYSTFIPQNIEGKSFGFYSYNNSLIVK